MRTKTFMRMAIAVAAVVGLTGGRAAGADGTWTLDGNGNWGTAGNWSGNAIADGVDSSASLTLELTGNRTITLDSARTNGNITFTDTTPSHNLTISGSYPLTLDVSSGSPIINVTQSDRNLTIGSSIAGNGGLQKNGPGTLTLSGANTYAGTTTLNGGTVALLANYYSTNGLNINANSTISVARNFAAVWNGALTGSGTLTLNGGYASATSSQLSLINNAGNTFSGNIVLGVDGGTLRIAGNPYATGTAAQGFINTGNMSSSTITINRGAALNIDDTVTSGYVANRFGAAGNRPAVSLAGGTFNLNGLNNASSSVQTLGALTATSGYSIVTITRNSNGNPTLTFGSLAISQGSVINFYSATLGTGLNDARITFGTGPTMINDIIAGAKVWSPGAAGQGDFATYGANGVAKFTAFTVYGANDINGATSTQNAQMTGIATAPVALAADTTVNSLNINGLGGTWNMTKKLTIVSGMILRNGNNSAIDISSGQLTAGTGSPTDLHFFTAQQNMSMSGTAVITNNGVGGVVTLVKSHGNSLTLNNGGDNPYSGGTYVLDGTLVTGNVADRRYLGSGAVRVDGNTTLTLGARGATSFSTANQAAYTALNGAQITIKNAAYTTTGNTFDIGAGSILAGDTATTAGNGLNSLTRVSSLTGIAAGQAVLAPGSIVAFGGTLTTGLGAGVLTLAGGAGTAADLYFGLANNTVAASTITVGAGTPWLGISTDRSARNYLSGTITANGDFNLQGLGVPGVVPVLLNMGSGGAMAVNTPNGNVNANILGAVTWTTASTALGSANNNLTFQVNPGATFTLTPANALGASAGSSVSVVVQNGGILAIGNAGAINAGTTIQAGGKFNANQAGGLTGTGVLTFNRGSIIDITSVTGFSGSQATAATVDPGSVVRLNVASYGAAGTTLDSFLALKSPIYEIFGADRAPANPTSPGTTILTLNKSANGVGGILVNDGSSRTMAATANGLIAVGANGGVISATIGTTLTILEDIALGGNLAIAPTGPIDGYPKEGSVTATGGLNLNNFTLTVDGSGTTDFRNTPNIITGNGGIIKNGTGLLYLGGQGTVPAHNFTGGIAISGGVVRVDTTQTNALFMTGGSVTMHGGVLEFYWAVTHAPTLGSGAGQIQLLGGASGFSQNGSATVHKFNNNAAYEVVWGAANEAGNSLATGFFNPSTLVLQANTAQAAGTIDFQNKLDLNGTTRTIAVNKTTSTTTGATISGAIGNSRGAAAGVIKTGPGILILTAANTYNGPTAISAGVLSLGNASALQNSAFDTANSITGDALNGLKTTVTTLTLGGLTGNRDFSPVFTTASGGYSSVTALTLNPAAGDTLNYSGVITNGAANMTLTKAGAGAQTLSGTNTYSGATAISGGTLSINSIASVSGGASAVGAPTTVPNGTIAIGSAGTAGTLQYTGSGHTSDRAISLPGTTGGATLDASGTGPLVLSSIAAIVAGAGSKTLTLTGSNTDSNTLAGIVQDNSAANKTSLTKFGAGTWVLSGINTYTGPTAVSNGTLRVDGSLNRASPVTISGLGVLGGVGTVGIVTNNGTLSPGNGAAMGTLTTSNLILNAGCTNVFDLGATIASDRVTVSGTLTLSGGVLTVVTNAGFGTGTYALFAYTNSSGTTLPSLGSTVAGYTMSVTNNMTAQQVQLVVQSGPTVVTPATATPDTTGGTSTVLSVLGADVDGGEANLTYTWTTNGASPAPVVYSANGNNTAKTTTATFSQSGVYGFEVVIADLDGLTVTSTVVGPVTVTQTVTTATVTPSPTIIQVGATGQFAVAFKDQFGLAVAPGSTSWGVLGGIGTIDGTGLFTATSGGSGYVTAGSGGVVGTATVTTVASGWTITASAGDHGTIAPSGAVTVPEGSNQTFTIVAATNYSIAAVLVDSVSQGTIGSYTFTNVTAAHEIAASFTNYAPTVAIAAAATPATVTSTSTVLTVMGADTESQATLTYTWSQTGTPPGVASLSANGSTAASNSTAVFTNTGTFDFQVVIADPPGLTVTSTVTVTVTQTVTSLTVTPASTWMYTGATQQFSVATVADQFVNAMDTALACDWSAGGAGAIDTATNVATLVAGLTPGTYEVVCSYGTASVTASVAVVEELFWDGATTNWQTAHWSLPTGGLVEAVSGGRYAVTSGMANATATPFPDAPLRVGAGGTLAVTAMATATGTVTLAGGTVSCAGTYSLTNLNGLVVAGGPNTVNVTANTLTLPSTISGTGAVTKAGSGVLRLSGMNTYNGGTVINGGTLWIAADANLGEAGSGITFNGSCGLSFGDNVTQSTTINLGSRPLVVNGAAVAGLYYNVAGTTITASNAVTGTGGITYGRDPVVTFLGGSGAISANLLSTSNTFTGPITIGVNASENIGVASVFTFNSLADSSSPMTFNVGGGLSFTYGTGAVANLSLANRPIYLRNSNVSFRNQNGTYALTLGSVSTDTAGSKTLNLTAGGGGASTIAGAITNGAGTIAVTASGGNWGLAGTNTYSGLTTIDSGMLGMLGRAALSPNTKVLMKRSTTLSLRMDDAGTVGLGNEIEVNAVDTATYITSVYTIDVRNSGGATTNSTIALGKIDFYGGNGDWASSRKIVVTGANGYRLQVGDVDMNVSSPSTQADGNQGFAPTTAPITIAGVVKQIDGNAGNTNANKLYLGGTAAGNLVSGVIANPSDYPTNANAQGLNVVKGESSDWTLSGTNTYSGTTTVNGGWLLVNGSLAAASTVTVSSAGALSGTGTVNGAVNILAGGTNAPGAVVGTNVIGTLTVGGSVTNAGTFAVDIDEVQTPKCDLLTVAGNLKISSATLKVNANGVLIGGSAYVIASYGTLTGTFAVTNGLPGTCSIDYNYLGGNQIAIVVAGDSVPPTPSPMGWYLDPWAAANGSVMMVATTATDIAGVQYCFTNTVNGDTSGWVDGPVWTNFGLTHGLTYTYKVKARDKSSSFNETDWSSERSATADGGILLYDSFELPVVSGRTGDGGTMAPGWTRSGVRVGLWNENSGTMTTPFGYQAAWVWSAHYMTTTAGLLGNTLTAGTAYTLTFNAAAESNGLGGIHYGAELLAGATVVGSTSGGPLTSSNMAAATGTISFTPDSDHPSLGQALAVRLRYDVGHWLYVVGYDNVKLTAVPDTTAPSPNPMAFEVPPFGINATSIVMTATNATDATGPVQYYFENTNTSANSGWSTNRTWMNTGLTGGDTYGYRVKARDFVTNETDWSAVATAVAQNETTPPSPSPMSFAIAPVSVDSTTIAMSATVASDTWNNPCEYYFENTSNTANSGWILGTTWTNTGLTPGETYGYHVKARDAVGTETDWSPEATATPDLDSTPPSPNPMGFEVLPAAIDAFTITMTASNATDFSAPVEYYFLNVSNSVSSGWVSSRVWTNGSLVPGNTYGYQVKARDALSNETDYSSVATAVAAAPAVTIFYDSFENPPHPDVAGFNITQTNSQGWVRSGTAGLLDEDSGYFSTPDGSQAAAMDDGGTYATSANLTNTLQAGATYTLTFTVASKNGVSVVYRAELLAGASALGRVRGTVASGTMAATVTISHTAPPSSTNFGQTLAIRLIHPNENTSADEPDLYFDNVRLTTTDTAGDSTPPAPNPPTWVVTPAPSMNNGLTMVATNATDARDVQYFFTNTVNGHVSGWQDEYWWTDTNLTADAIYTFKVKARDNSANLNETDWSAAASGTVDPYVVFYESFENPKVYRSGALACPGWYSNSGMQKNEDGELFTTPYGAQVGDPNYLGSGGRIEATNINAVLQRRYDYTVTFNVGNTDVSSGVPRSDNQYTVELIAGSNVIASVSDITTTDDLSDSGTLTFYSPVGHPDLGQRLKLRFYMSGGQYYAHPLFDNVRLRAVPCPSGSVFKFR